MKLEAQLNERIVFEQEEGTRRLESAIAERDGHVDHLIEDNKMLQSRLSEEDRVQA